MMDVLSAGATDPGKKRLNNEDSYLVLDGSGLYAVADGVGGSEGGEVASRIALETVAAVLSDLLGEKDRTPAAGLRAGKDRPSAALHAAVTMANRTIRSERQQPGLADMGTTLTALLLQDNRAYLAHVGDSRAYILRKKKLKQVTSDHSLVAEQVRAGMLKPDEARRSPYRHVITRALGMEEDVAPDIVSQALKPGDTVLLCTDGLTEMVDDRRIAAILAKHPPADAVRELLSAANDGGGVDNITAVVVRLGS